MRLGGRIAAAGEVLADCLGRNRPVADALKDWGLSHRFAGSGDRAAIGTLAHDALRRRRSYAWRLGVDDDAAAEAGPPLAFAAALDGFDLMPDALRERLDGDRFAPDLPLDRLARFVEADLALAPGAVRGDVPDWLAPAFETAFGDGWSDEAAALTRRPPLDLRANTLKATRDKLLPTLAAFGAEAHDLAPDAIRIPPISGAGRHPNIQVEPGFLKGRFEVQDAGSQLAACLSRPEDARQVLDLCAGGGGKTLALAALMGGRGQVHATDADRQRLAPIYDRVQRAGARNVQIHDPRSDLSGLEGRMDLVLVDAPCTGTGTWRRRPDAKWRLTPKALAARQGEQDAVLAQAARYVTPGGRLVYVTCSLLVGENAERVEAFLAGDAGTVFRAADTAATWNAVVPGAPDACHRMAVGTGSAIVMTPARTGTDGFFVATLERAS